MYNIFLVASLFSLVSNHPDLGGIVLFCLRIPTGYEKRNFEDQLSQVKRRAEKHIFIKSSQHLL